MVRTALSQHTRSPGVRRKTFPASKDKQLRSVRKNVNKPPPRCKTPGRCRQQRVKRPGRETACARASDVSIGPDAAVNTRRRRTSPPTPPPSRNSFPSTPSCKQPPSLKVVPRSTPRREKDSVSLCCMCTALAANNSYYFAVWPMGGLVGD